LAAETDGIRTVSAAPFPLCGAPAEAHMPREKYAKPPKALPPMEQIPRVTFRFDDENRQELKEMLPARLHELMLQDAPAIGCSVAEVLVQSFENSISSHLTNELRAQRFGVPNRANYVAGINKLRDALAPFVTGSMDAGTVDVLLGGFLGTPGMFDAEMATNTLQRVDGMLADRVRELKDTNMAPAAVRNREVLISELRRALRTCDAYMSYREQVDFMAQALDFADIEHDDPEAHPGRLIPRVG
jgi:hypothetical protein